MYHLLRKAVRNQARPQKSDVYTALFSGEYDKKKDYLLRNELRLLSDALTDFLAIRKFRAEMKKSPRLKDKWLIKVLAEKGLGAHLETRVKKGVTAAKADQDYGVAADILNQYHDFVMASRESHGRRFHDLIDRQNDRLQLLQWHFTEEIRFAETKIAGLCRILRITEPDTQFPEAIQQLELDDPNSATPFAMYMRHFAAAYQLRGKDRIQRLEIAWEHLQNVAQTRRGDLDLTLLGSVALEHFFLGDYVEADRWYNRILETAGKRSIEITLIFNYLSNLIKLRKFETATHIFNTYEAEARAHSRVYYRFQAMAAMSHIFLGDPKSAMSAVPHDIHHRPEPQYNYFRFVIVLIYYLRGDHEDTLREIRNFLQALQTRKSHEIDIRPMVRFFREFVMLASETPENRENRLPDLHKRVAEYAATLPPVLSDYLPFTYVREAISVHQ
ncbi:MAG: hypothetical protein AAF570_09625 [Bacteroidota bacterium]